MKTTLTVALAAIAMMFGAGVAGATEAKPVHHHHVAKHVAHKHVATKHTTKKHIASKKITKKHIAAKHAKKHVASKHTKKHVG